MTRTMDEVYSPSAEKRKIIIPESKVKLFGHIDKNQRFIVLNNGSFTDWVKITEKEAMRPKSFQIEKLSSDLEVILLEE